MRAIQVLAMDPSELQTKFVTAVQGNELFLAHVFYTTKLYAPILLPNRVVAVFHCDGMYLMDAAYNKVKSYSYADLYRWGGSTTQFTLTIWNSETQSTFELLLKVRVEFVFQPLNVSLSDATSHGYGVDPCRLHR